MRTGEAGPGVATHPALTIEDLRREIVGIETPVPLLDGSEQTYVHLDNAASTPAFRSVLNAVGEFLPWYSGVHRGTGFKSLVSTNVFDTAHDVVARFVGADPAREAVVFTKNTTECVNKLAYRMRLSPDDVVVASLLEHHSNDLPWRRYAKVVHVGMTSDGHQDLAGLKAVLDRERGRVRIVAVTGASNITGLCPPIHDIARWAHAAGAKIFVDAAQLAPHREISMLPYDDESHIDFLAFSAHKMYAPFGTGVLLGPTAFFSEGDPDMVGGGVVDVVTLDRAVWNKPPAKEEAGSPNVVGAVALAAAITTLESVGMKAVADHEQDLLDYGYRKLKTVPNIRLYGPTDGFRDKVGVMPFNLGDMHHSLVAAILGVEAGIGVRDGCFCAHPYVKELLGVSPEDDQILSEEVIQGNKSRMPGMVRASIGCYSSKEDIDMLIEALRRIAGGDIRGRYHQDRTTGAFHAEGFAPDFGRYCSQAAAGTAERTHSEAS